MSTAASKDCYSCRFVTAATFTALGSHSIFYAARHYVRPGSIVGKAFFHALGAAFIGMGVYKGYPLFTGKWEEDRRHAEA